MKDENAVSSDKTKYYIFILILIALLNLIDGLDSTIVNIALEDIGTDLDTDPKWTSWIVIAYMIPTVGFIVLFGKIFQTKAIKKILVISVIAFGVTSLICGMSQNIETLVTFRFLQGLSGAALLSATPILVVRELPESKLSIGMATMAIVTGIATTLGPTIGSIITESPLTWHGIFYINVPICIAIVAIIIMGYKENTSAIHNTDIPRMPICICYAFAVMMFVLVISTLEAINKDPVQLLCLGGVFALSLAAGVIVYRDCIRDDNPHPLFHKTLVQNKEVILTTLSFICTTITAAIITFLLPFYLDKCMGVGNKGIYFAVSSVITIICSVIAGKWCQRYGCKQLTVVAIICRMAFACVFLVITPEMGMAPVYIGLALMGVSFGLSGTSQPTRIVQHADKKDKEDASNIMLTGNYLGASLGTALAVIVMYIAVPGAYGARVSELTSSMITSGMHACAVFSLIVNLIALVCTLKVRNIIPTDEPEPKTESDAQSQ